MEYRNKRNGEIRNFSCTIKSDVWEPIEKAPALSVDKKTTKQAKTTKK